MKNAEVTIKREMAYRAHPATSAGRAATGSVLTALHSSVRYAHSRTASPPSVSFALRYGTPAAVLLYLAQGE